MLQETYQDKSDLSTGLYSKQDRTQAWVPFSKIKFDQLEL